VTVRGGTAGPSVTLGAAGGAGSPLVSGSDGWLDGGTRGFVGIDERAATFASRGLSGNGVCGGCTTGLAVGQALTPPPWTVPHQAQKAGCELTGDIGLAAAAG